MKSTEEKNQTSISAEDRFSCKWERKHPAPGRPDLIKRSSRVKVLPSGCPPSPRGWLCLADSLHTSRCGSVVQTHLLAWLSRGQPRGVSALGSWPCSSPRRFTRAPSVLHAPVPSTRASGQLPGKTDPPRFEQVLPHNRPHTVPEAPSRRPQALFEFALPPAPGFSCSWSNSERILLPGREAEPHLRSEHSGRPAQCEPRGGHRNTKLRGRPGSARRAE